MERSMLVIERRDDTRWHVCETCPRRSLASFGLQQDALEYARDLATAWTSLSEFEAAGMHDIRRTAARQATSSAGARSTPSYVASTTKKPAMSAG
jgi:hypothetical protein